MVNVRDSHDRGVHALLWPNLAGLELAPTTAKNFEEKNRRAVASVVMSGTSIGTGRGFKMGSGRRIRKGMKSDGERRWEGGLGAEKAFEELRARQRGAGAEVARGQSVGLRHRARKWRRSPMM